MVVVVNIAGKFPRVNEPLRSGHLDQSGSHALIPGVQCNAQLQPARRTERVSVPRHFA